MTEHNFGRVSSGIKTLPQRLDYTDSLRPASGKNAFGSPTADGVQRAIVIQVKGNDIDDYGSLDDMKKALEFAQPGVNEYTRVGSPGVALSTSNKELFKTEVQKGRYILAGFSKKGSILGHVVAITDYNSSTNTYTLYDPWNGSSHTITGDKIFTYSNDLAGSKDSLYGLEYFFYIA